MARTGNRYYLVAAVLSALSALVLFIAGGEYRWLWYVFMLAAAGFGRLGELLDEKQPITGPVATATLENSATEAPFSPAPVPPTKLGTRETFICAIAILLHTRKTIRSLLARNRPGPIHLLAVLAGVAWTAELAANGYYGEPPQRPVSGILLLVLLLGTLQGVILLYVFGFLWGVVGRRLGGIADDSQMRVAFAWAHVPLAWSLIPRLPALILFPEVVFHADVLAEPPGWAPLLMLIHDMGMFAGSTWSIVASVKSVSETHHYSTWRALAVVAISSALMFVITRLAGR